MATPTSAELDSQPGREFFQQRLGIFGLWNAILSFGFVPLRIAGELLLNPTRSLVAVLATPSMAAHLGEQKYPPPAHHSR